MSLIAVYMMDIFLIKKIYQNLSVYSKFYSVNISTLKKKWYYVWSYKVTIQNKVYYFKSNGIYQNGYIKKVRLNLMKIKVNMVWSYINSINTLLANSI